MKTRIFKLILGLCFLGSFFGLMAEGYSDNKKEYLAKVEAYGGKEAANAEAARIASMNVVQRISFVFSTVHE